MMVLSPAAMVREWVWEAARLGVGRGELAGESLCLQMDSREGSQTGRSIWMN